jgi:hypothetical protein
MAASEMLECFLRTFIKQMGRCNKNIYISNRPAKDYVLIIYNILIKCGIERSINCETLIHEDCVGQPYFCLICS